MNVFTDLSQIHNKSKCPSCPSTGLALDYFGQRLYWADAELSVIGSVGLDGSGALVVINGKQGKMDK